MKPKLSPKAMKAALNSAQMPPPPPEPGQILYLSGAGQNRHTRSRHFPRPDET